MARIRTIKPEFWTDERLVECSTSARLLFVGLWSFSDDRGIHVFSLKRLIMEIYPADAITVEGMEGYLRELYDQKLIGVYKYEDKLYIKILGWHHQKIDRPSVAFYLPYSANPWTIKTKKFDDILDECSTSAQRTLATYSKVTERNVKEKKTRKKKKSESFKKDAQVVLDFLNLKASTNFRSQRNLDFIAARLKSGVEIKHCKWVIIAKCNEWLTDQQNKNYLRPSTLFNEEKFEQYYGQLNWDLIRKNELLKKQGENDDEENKEMSSMSGDGTGGNEAV